MDTSLNAALPTHLCVQYKSNSQRARVCTESWALDNLFCPNCGGSLLPATNGTSVYDFSCPDCCERYQLKGERRAKSYKSLESCKRVLGAEYRTTLNSVEKGSHPSFLLLKYDDEKMVVLDIAFIHRSCITMSCLSARKPLAPTARRAGWQGVSFLLDRIPTVGWIPVMVAGVPVQKSDVITSCSSAQKMLSRSLNSRNWPADMLCCIDQLGIQFRIDEAYQFEAHLASLHPENKRVREKIRRQLQSLRDLGMLHFDGNGVYRRLYVLHIERSGRKGVQSNAPCTNQASPSWKSR